MADDNPTPIGVADTAVYAMLVRNLLFLQKMTPAAHKFGARRPGQVVDEIILHGTESKGDQTASRNALATSGESQSIHYWIGRDTGLLFAIVPEEKQAWHAGNPNHVAGVVSHNPRSIGIEMYQQDISIVGKASALDFTDWQYETVAMLAYDICRRWKISPVNIVSHESVNHVERGDPKNFDWDRFWTAFDQIAASAGQLDAGLAVPTHAQGLAIQAAVNSVHDVAKRMRRLAALARGKHH